MHGISVYLNMLVGDILAKARRYIEKNDDGTITVGRSKPPEEDGKFKATCIACGIQKPNEEFYASSNPNHNNGLMPICKDCMKQKSYNKVLGQIDPNKFKTILRQCDVPFVNYYWNSAVSSFEKKMENKDIQDAGEIDQYQIIGEYFRLLRGLRNIDRLTYDDSDWLNEKYRLKDEKQSEKSAVEKTKSSKGTVYALKVDDYRVTPDAIKLFGAGYTEAEYKAMQEKYDYLSVSYPTTTNLHVEALATYVRYKVKAEMATTKGDAGEAKKWDDMATAAATKAKINPSQLSQRDLQGGLNSFSELFKAVEEAEDIISILPEFKYRPNDAPDFIIWCYVNYVRGLEGKPLCPYEDIYKFYDERKQEYIEQYGDPYGIFANDTTDKNRENIERFIDVPADDEEDVEEGETDG